MEPRHTGTDQWASSSWAPSFWRGKWAWLRYRPPCRGLCETQVTLNRI